MTVVFLLCCFCCYRCLVNQFSSQLPQTQTQIQTQIQSPRDSCLYLYLLWLLQCATDFICLKFHLKSSNWLETDTHSPMNGLTIEGVWSGQTFPPRNIEGPKTRHMKLKYFQERFSLYTNVWKMKRKLHIFCILFFKCKKSAILNLFFKAYSTV